MPQGPLSAVVLSTAQKRALNITANTVVKAANGFVVTVSVIATSSTAGSIHDAATVAAAATANQLAVIPATAGVYTLNFPTSAGIVVKPGSGQTIAVSYT